MFKGTLKSHQYHKLLQRTLNVKRGYYYSESEGRN